MLRNSTLAHPCVAPKSIPTGSGYTPGTAQPGCARNPCPSGRIFSPLLQMQGVCVLDAATTTPCAGPQTERPSLVSAGAGNAPRPRPLVQARSWPLDGRAQQGAATLEHFGDPLQVRALLFAMTTPLEASGAAEAVLDRAPHQVPLDTQLLGSLRRQLRASPKTAKARRLDKQLLLDPILMRPDLLSERITPDAVLSLPLRKNIAWRAHHDR